MKYGEYIKTPDGLGRTQDPAWHGLTLAEGEVLVSVLSGDRRKAHHPGAQGVQDGAMRFLRTLE